MLSEAIRQSSTSWRWSPLPPAPPLHARGRLARASRAARTTGHSSSRLLYVSLLCVLRGTFAELWCAPLAPPTAAAAVLSRVLLTEAADNGVACMDGSPLAYYTGGNASSKCLVIYLEGGGYFSPGDETSVFGSDKIGSSKAMPPTHEGRGLLATNIRDNPVLSCCRHVLITYCTRDFYSGAGSWQPPDSAPDESPLQFQGASVLNVVLASLDAAAPLATHTRVLLSGSSAGAIGASLHAARVQTEWWPTAPDAVHLLADSGWFVETPYLSEEVSHASGTPLSRIRAGIGAWNGVAGLQLLGCNITPPEDCYRFEATSPHFRLPALYLNAIQDLVALDAFDSDVVKDIPSALAAFATYASFFRAWAGGLRHSFQRTTATWPETLNNRSHVFAPSCMSHTFHFATAAAESSISDWLGPAPGRRLLGTSVSGSQSRHSDLGLRVFSMGATTGPGVYRYADVLAAWLNGAALNASAMPANIMDACLTLACNPTCPIDVYDLLPHVTDTLGNTASIVSLAMTATLVAFAVVLNACYAIVGARKWRAQRTKSDRPSKFSFYKLRESVITAGMPISSSVRTATVGLSKAEPITLAARGLSYWPVNTKPQVINGKLSLKGALLRNVYLRIGSGEVTAIMGPSGAGKTTLLDILSGRRVKGVVAGAICVHAMPDHQSQPDVISYVERDDVFLETLTVLETLRHHLLLTQADVSQHAKRLRGILRLLGLDDATNTRLRDCSSGQRRRVSVAMALAQEKPVLFLDEPTSGLDASSALELMHLLKAVAARGRAVVLSIHQPREEIFSAMDNVIVMSQGEVISECSPKEMVDRFQLHGSDHASTLLDVVTNMTAAQHAEAAAAHRARWAATHGDVFVTDTKPCTSATSWLQKWSPTRHTIDGLVVRPPRPTGAGPVGRTDRLASAPLWSTQRPSVLPALLFRAFCIDRRRLTGLIAFYVFGMGIFAGNFANFQINSLVDSTVFATTIGIAIVLARYVFLERTVLLMQAELFALEYEIRQGMYSAFDYVMLSILRHAVLLWLLVGPVYVTLYYSIGFSSSGLACIITLLCLILAVTTIVALVTHAFCYGLKPAIAVSLIFVYDFSETFYSGVIVPLEYLDVWLSWPRYVSPSYHGLRVILFVNLQARKKDCTDTERLDKGAFGCYELSSDALLHSLGFADGDDISFHIFSLLGMTAFLIFLSWFVLVTRWHRTLRVIEEPTLRSVGDCNGEFAAEDIELVVGIDRSEEGSSHTAVFRIDTWLSSSRIISGLRGCESEV